VAAWGGPHPAADDGLPQSRQLPAIARRCHELRIIDAAATWRIVYRIDVDALVVAEVFS
jgi:hypothetical protein